MGCTNCGAEAEFLVLLRPRVFCTCCEATASSNSGTGSWLVSQEAAAISGGHRAVQRLGGRRSAPQPPAHGAPGAGGGGGATGIATAGSQHVWWCCCRWRSAATASGEAHVQGCHCYRCIETASSQNSHAELDSHVIIEVPRRPLCGGAPERRHGCGAGWIAHGGAADSARAAPELPASQKDRLREYTAPSRRPSICTCTAFPL